jgi:hypothetical protein
MGNDLGPVARRGGRAYPQDQVHPSKHARLYGNEEVPQSLATDYQLVLEVIKTTGSISYSEEYVPGGYFEPKIGRVTYFRRLSDKPKLKTIKLVKNVVLLESPE